jgi:uncharacterized protein YfaS (alpha-2-macroglobulin family)
LPSSTQLDEAVNSGLKRLGRLQLADGGFATWSPTANESSPFVSIHVAHALARIKAKQAAGSAYQVDANVLDGAMRYLREIKRHLSRLQYTNKRVINSLVAYSLVWSVLR